MQKQILSLLFIVLVNKEVKTQIFEPYFGAVIVENIDSSVAWYTKILNLKIIKRQENKEAGYKIVNLGNDEILLELLELNSSVSAKTLLEKNPGKKWVTGIMKIGFKTDDIDLTYDNFKSMNLKFRGGIVTDPDTNKKMFIIIDPDGNYIQFFEK